MQNKLQTELLLIEKNETVIDFFKVLTKKFNIKIKYAKSMDEFIDLVKIHDFQNVICDGDSINKFELVFFSKFYNNTNNIHNTSGNFFILSEKLKPDFKVLNFPLTGIINKDFLSIYNFFKENFKLKTYSDFIRQQILIESIIEA